MNNTSQENKFLKILSKACNTNLEFGNILKSLEWETYHKIILKDDKIYLIKCDVEGIIIETESRNSLINIEDDVIKGNTFNYVRGWIKLFKLVSKHEQMLNIKAATKEDKFVDGMDIENLYIITYKKQLLGYCNLQESKNFDTDGFSENIFDIASIIDDYKKNYLYFLETYNAAANNEIIKMIFEFAKIDVIITEIYPNELEEWKNRGSIILKKNSKDLIYGVVLSKSNFILNSTFKNNLNLNLKHYSISEIEQKMTIGLKKIIMLKKGYSFDCVKIYSDSTKKDWGVSIEIKEHNPRIKGGVSHIFALSFISNFKYHPCDSISSELLNLYGIHDESVIAKYFNYIFKNGRYKVL